jgi:peptidoglycan/LPS O-acetylase OafA/YrhL
LSAIRYRPEIDGLRALAVVPILLFHAGYAFLPGGFIGVDIFFVISGYLLGSIILREIDGGVFTVRRFYERRVRRILPALLATIFSTLLLGYFFLLPEEMLSLGKSSIGALLFVPNIVFWDQSSTYFGLDIATQPLLHTWSLGVEEQFYLLLPALLLWCRRWGDRKYRADAILWLLIAASFGINILMLPIDSKFSFYMLPARAWEPLLGVALASLMRRRRPGPVSGPLTAILGLALCCWGIFTLDEAQTFPGFNALYPTVGAALLIFGTARERSAVGSLLRLSPLVLIGRISYSLYLWHWPVLVYLFLLLPEYVYRSELVVALSLVLATMSYRLIEQRYRSSRAAAPRGSLRELYAVSAVLLAVIAINAVSAGVPRRVPDSAWAAAGVPVDPATFAPCEVLLDDPDHESRVCRLGVADQTPSFAIWGDSHANALSLGAHEAALELGQAGLLYFGSGCRPLLGVSRPFDNRCLRYNEAVAADLADRPAIKAVFLVGYWRVSMTGQGFDTAMHFIEDEQSNMLDALQNRLVFQRGLQRTIAALDGRHIVVVEDVPEVGAGFGKSVSNHFVRDAWLGIERSKPAALTLHEDQFSRDWLKLKAELGTTVDYLGTTSVLCQDSDCPLRGDGMLRYADGDHLSEAGSRQMSPLFARALSDLKPVD